MSVEDNILHLIIEKFPDYAQEIKSMYVECEEFKEICQDYVLCLNSIKKIESTEVKRDKYLQEFKNTLQELEEELYLNLKNYKDNNTEK